MARLSNWGINYVASPYSLGYARRVFRRLVEDANRRYNYHLDEAGETGKEI